jgi:peptide/nickel transport system permease protein|tara:strand:- start:6953 stop:7786 length:834 start_codon:yes stop_codon:yes gene_type:complete
MFKIFNYLRNPIEIAAMSFIVLITLIALIGPLVAPHDPYEANFNNTFSAPSSEYIFGTDAAGRDVFSRVLFGAKLTLATTLFIIFIVSSIGIFIGIISALSGGIIDNLLMRFTDIWLGFPPLILALGFAASFGAGMKAAILALIFTWWPNYARLSRALIIETKDKEFILSAKAMGVSDLRIIFSHLIPNAFDVLFVQISLDVAAVILVISGLSFIGVGAQIPLAEWGAMIADGRSAMSKAWWVVFFPGLAILLTAISFNLIGDVLRRELDPNLSGNK